MLMTRNLLYTAVTRARKCVTIVGSDVTFQAMIGNHIEGEPVYNARQKNPGMQGRKRINTFFRGMDAAASGRVDKGKRRLHERKNKTGNWLLNAVYPRRCPICDGLLSREELYLCRNCVERSIRFWARGAKMRETRGQ